MSDPTSAAKSLVAMLGLPKHLLGMWIHQAPAERGKRKPKPIICVAFNPKTPRATLAATLKRLPQEIHGIKIQREKWSQPIDERAYVEKLVKMVNKTIGATKPHGSS